MKSSDSVEIHIIFQDHRSKILHWEAKITEWYNQLDME